MSKLEKNVKVIDEEAVVEVTETKKKKKLKLGLTIGGVVALIIGGIAVIAKVFSGKKADTEIESEETYTEETNETNE